MTYAQHKTRSYAPHRPNPACTNTKKNKKKNTLNRTMMIITMDGLKGVLNPPYGSLFLSGGALLLLANMTPKNGEAILRFTELSMTIKSKPPPFETDLQEQKAYLQSLKNRVERRQ